jgi:beta-xylosidase
MKLTSLATGIMLFTVIHAAVAQDRPANIPGDFADPSIVRTGDSYYAIGTSSEWAPHFPIFRSRDLTQWDQVGFLFDEAPSWTASSFWAPEYFYHNNTYYVYYTAKRKRDGVSCIGVATSQFPDHGFKDHGIMIEYGKEAIDAFVFDDNGQLYITWKAYGLDKRPIELLGSKLSDDGLSLIGEPFTLLKDDRREGIEGQSIVKKDNYYYLFYSAGACCGAKCNYNVRVARATSIKGPYEDYAHNPVLTDKGDWKCPGHGTFVQDAKGDRFYVYHAYNKGSHVFTGREGMVSALSWKDQWPVFSPVKAKETKERNSFHYNFAKTNEKIFWQWDFRNMQPSFLQADGKLRLSGKTRNGNPSGTALTVRPYSAAYEISTVVLNHNKASKGLIIYGDASAATGIAVRDNKVEFWATKDDQRTVLKEKELQQPEQPVYLKMVVSPDFTCKVYWKQGPDWQELTADNKPFSIGFLPPWDRSPRPGLSFLGREDDWSEFGFFDARYK